MCLWTSSRHSNNGLRLNSIDSDLELFNLDLDELAFGVDLQLELVLGKVDLVLVLLLYQFELGLLADPLRVHLKLSLIHLRLRFYQIGFGLGTGIRNCQARRTHALVFSFEFPIVFIHFFVLDLRVNFQALEHPIRFLFQTHSLVLGSGLLRTCLNFECHID